MMKSRFCGMMLVVAAMAATAVADEFQLLTGVDATRAPGVARVVAAQPGPNLGPGGQFVDGDRLAGTPDVGPVVNWLGSGTPIIAPNQFGSLSFMFRRGSLGFSFPPQPVLPIMAVEYLGGPQLDLDGDLNNGVRSLVPVSGQTPVAIPGSRSGFDLSLDRVGGTAGLTRFDVTGTNEGSQGLQSGNAVTVNTLAGTSTSGIPGAGINPTIDTRSGSLTPFVGGGSLAGVYQIGSLGYEFWQDPVESTSSSASTLGTFQYLGSMRGWLIERDPNSGQFPVLAGQGLGSTLWASTNSSGVGLTINTTHPVQPTALITNGTAKDVFSAAGNGGLPLTAFGGDLGAYLDAVVVPLIDPLSTSFVYLESAGFGASNSADPVFGETVGYDTVLIAQSRPVPEPATLGLFIAAAAVLRRRKP